MRKPTPLIKGWGQPGFLLLSSPWVYKNTWCFYSLMCRKAALALGRRRTGTAHFFPYCEYAQCRIWRSGHAVGEHAVYTACLQSDSLYCMRKTIRNVWRSLLFAHHSSPHRARCQMSVRCLTGMRLHHVKSGAALGHLFPLFPTLQASYSDITVRTEMRQLPFSSPYIPRRQVCQEKETGTATKFTTTPPSQQLLLLYIQ